MCYQRMDVNGLEHDTTWAAVFDTETGMKIWQSGSALTSGRLSRPPEYSRPGSVGGDLQMICAEDGFAYVVLTVAWARAFGGVRVVAYDLRSAQGSPQIRDDFGLPWFPKGSYAESGIHSLGQRAIGLVKQPLQADDGLFYFMPCMSAVPGLIFTPGSHPGTPGKFREMPWSAVSAPSNGFLQAGGFRSVVFLHQGVPHSYGEWGTKYVGGSVMPIGIRSAYGDFGETLSSGPWDMNPAHIIRECMTNTEWGRGLPESIIGPTYIEVAETLYKERLGLSMLWTSEMAVNDFILEVIRHIDAVRYEDPETGLQEIKLIRPDYNVDTLPVLSPDNCRVEQLTEPTLYDLVNQVTVNFWNRDSGEDSAVAVQDTASINMVGTINNQTMEYSGICRTDVAMMVGQRDLARYSKPFRQGRLVVNRKIANLKPGDPFVLNWPSRGVSRLVCRVARRSDNGALDGMMGIEFGEDIFSAPFNVAAVPPPSGWEDPIAPPVNFSHVTMFDAPYTMLVDLMGEVEAAAIAADTSYAGFAGTRPLSGMHLRYGAFIYPAGTTPPTDIQKEIVESFTPLAITEEDVPAFTTEIFDIKVNVANDMNNARAGDWVLVGNAADAEREMLCLAADPGDQPTSLKVIRGTGDTYPRAIPKGTPLYVVGTFYAYDEVERLSGEPMAGYGRPKNGKGSYEGPFTYLQVDMVGRQGRPYPAAGFKVEGSFDDDLVTVRDSVTLTWHHRNRIGQANSALSWLAPSDVAVEPGVAYRVKQEALDANQAAIEVLPPVPAGTGTEITLRLLEQPYPDNAVFARLSVEAVKGDRVSLQNRPVKIKLPVKLRRPYNLRPGAAAALTKPYNLRPGVDYALKKPYNLRPSVQSDLLAPYHLRPSVQAELVAPYNLRSSVQAELLPPYNLLPGMKELAILPPYNLRSSVQAELLAPYSLRSSVQAELLAPYSLRSSVQAELLAPYSLRSSVQAELLAPYSLRSSVQAELLGPYSLRASVQAELVPPFGLVPSAQAELVSPYNVRVFAQGELVAPYNLRPYGLAE